MYEILEIKEFKLQKLLKKNNYQNTIFLKNRTKFKKIELIETRLQ